MSHADVVLSHHFVYKTEQVSALTVFLVKGGYRVTLVDHPGWLQIAELSAQMRRAVVNQLYVLTLVNAQKKQLCSIEVWMTDGEKAPVCPPTEKLEVFLHLGYKEESMAKVDVDLASDCKEDKGRINARIKTIIEEALGPQIKISWEKEDS